MPHCYGVRMLNPYRGVMQVVETDEADAVSRDGVTWTLYVHGEREQAQLDDGRWCEVETPDIKFGVWSQEAGLTRAPVRNVVDYEFIDHIGRYLIDTIRTQRHTLPFPLRDHYELWLLDAAFDLPLALIDSTHDPSRISDDIPLRWRAGVLAREQFRLGAGLAERLGETLPAEALESRVNQAAGARPRAQWFRRQSSGEGIAVGGIRLEAALAGRRLPAHAFPEQQLRSHWPDHFDQVLVRAYLDWLAPWLLMLSHLRDETRDRLELIAGRRAMLLAESHTLLPKVIDPKRITAARVEAKLRKAAGEVEPRRSDQQQALFPFFNE